MKGVTLEFEKQMSALINKLIQENFEQLNQSVANMNQWQQENKEMIVALTSQYKQMSTDFEETSTTLQKVGDETKSLISDGGRLHQIIEGLEQVMAKDKDFVATANSLKKAAEINEKNMAEYQEYTRNLNVWVQKQRDFVEGVKQLIKKLEELDKLRDFNNDFWAETKKNLEEAQGLMQNGAFFLRKELEGLDQHFYDRLSETLAQLDACIQAMITKNKK
jgi:chromosome segregation ATPase